MHAITWVPSHGGYAVDRGAPRTGVMCKHLWGYAVDRGAPVYRRYVQAPQAWQAANDKARELGWIV